MFIKEKYPMLISTLEHYLKTYCSRSDLIFDDKEKEHERIRIIEAFSHTVVIEAAYEEFDHVELWCWKKFGPSDGLCRDAYNYVHACPVVLAAPSIKDVRYARHEHVGMWCKLWLGKTDYDYGFSQFCFKNSDDKNAFLEAITEIEDMTEKWSRQERNS